MKFVPMYVRGGAIIPTGPAMNYVGEKPTNPLEFQIYPNESGEASTVLYEDDGLTESYLQGSFRRTGVTYRNNQIEIAAPTGTFRPAPRLCVP